MTTLTKMKTLADFKRALHIGDKWEAYNHYYKSTLGVRAVSVVKTNCFAFESVKDGETRNSWFDFPKASDIEFLDDGTVNIYTNWTNGRVLMLSYKKVEA